MGFFDKLKQGLSKTKASFNEKINNVVNMRPYLDGFYFKENAEGVIARFDIRGFQYKNLIDFKRFQKEIESLKPRKNG